MLFCEASPKEDINVNYIFRLIPKMVLEKIHENNNHGLQYSSVSKYMFLIKYNYLYLLYVIYCIRINTGHICMSKIKIK